MRPTANSLFKTLACAAMFVAFAATAQMTPKPSSPKLDFATELAKADLAKKGITAPTQMELDVAAKSIQDQRASGMGWGEIANSLGLKLGPVVSAANRAKQADDGKRTETADSRKGAARSEASRNGERAESAGRSDGGRSGGQGSGGNGGNNGGGGGGGGGGGKK